MALLASWGEWLSHSVLVWPHLEYFVKLWSPEHKDIKLSKHVQRRFTEMVNGLEGKKYEEWMFVQLREETEGWLQHRQQLLHEGKALVSLVTSDRSWGNRLNLWQVQVEYLERFFIKRVAGCWNRLSREVVMAVRLLVSKKCLHSALRCRVRMVLFGARSLTQWSLWVPSNSWCPMILWFYSSSYSEG